MSRLLIKISVLLLIAFSCGCDSGSLTGNYVPNSFEGDWNISGRIATEDQSIAYDIDEDIEIRNGRVFRSGIDTLDSSFIFGNFNIRYVAELENQIVLDCGRVITSVDSSFVFPIYESDEIEYPGSAIGAFHVISECDPTQIFELHGTMLLKRI